jgi:hypothetical protein
MASPELPMMIGTVDVTFFAATSALVPDATMAATLRATSSEAIAGSRSYFPSAHRESMTIFLPSM